MRSLALGCFALLFVAATAQAEWLEASSDHFVIYGDQKEKALRDFSERLERYDAAMAYIFGVKRTQPSPSNRVTIFVVSSWTSVQKVIGAKNKSVAGVYIPHAGSCVAIIPTLKRASNDWLAGETILYHEYAHHFMIAGLTARAYPRWFVEGFAEFFASTRFKEDGSVILGMPPAYRADELAYGSKVPIRSLLDFDGGADSSNGSSAFYGQSWLLFHYLHMAPERVGQISRYQQALAAGHSALESAESAFGDLGELKADLDRYMRRPTIGTLVIAGKALATGPIAVRKLRPGEAAVMPILVESKAGVSEEEARSLVPEARKVAERYPDEPMVLSELAEAEFDAGNDEAAIAVADRALTLDPKLINAYIQKGYALARRVESGALPEESWKDVRTWFVKANAVENDNPIPLVQFYLTYLKQGERPTKNAIDGLEWAMTLAPFDGQLRWMVAQQMVSDKRYKDAVETLGPLAYSPHPGEHTDTARELLKDVESRLAAEQESSAESGKAQ